MRAVITIIIFVLLASPSVAQTISVIESLGITDYGSFEDSLRKNIEYPPEAIRKGIEGTVHLEIKFDDSYRIIPESVHVRSGLSAACDREAVRVVKAYRQSFRTKAGSALPPLEPVILPVVFKIKDGRTYIAPVPGGQQISPFKAVIRSKGLTDTKTNPQWAVYCNWLLDKQVKTLAPADTVMVTGYAASTFFIRCPFVEGYIPYRALEGNPKIDSLARIIESLPSEEGSGKQFDNALKIIAFDTLKTFHAGSGRLSLSANTKSLAPGECATVTLSFDVDDENKLPFQFYDPGPQLMRQWSLFDGKECISLNDVVDEVVGIGRFGGINGGYTEYPLYRRTYCPANAHEINLPAFRLNMIVGDTGAVRNGTVRRFESKPLKISFKPLPPGVSVSTFHKFRMAGVYYLTERLSADEIKVNQKFEYTVEVNGTAPSSLIEPVMLNVPGMEIQLKEIRDAFEKDFPGFSSRTFVYVCLAKLPGMFDMAGKIRYVYLNIATGKADTLKSGRRIVVTGTKTIADRMPRDHEFFSKSKFIAIDVSQSMLIEDYPGNRLATVKEGILKFFDRNKMCDVQLILFGGRAMHFSPAGYDSCYSDEWIKQMSGNYMRSGTAIGDAIWLASVSAKQGFPGKVVLIGDGDNTAGVLEPSYAAGLAKSRQIKLYTIGVGNAGAVPFGKDERGQPYFILNTFSDKHFKKISLMTGGEYRWAKDAEAIADALEAYFSK